MIPMRFMVVASPDSLNPERETYSPLLTMSEGNTLHAKPRHGDGEHGRGMRSRRISRSRPRNLCGCRVRREGFQFFEVIPSSRISNLCSQNESQINRQMPQADSRRTEQSGSDIVLMHWENDGREVRASSPLSWFLSVSARLRSLPLSLPKCARKPEDGVGLIG
jgi:hypothetical protein